MGLYNMVFGVNQLAPVLLSALGFRSISEVGRFRDAFISEGKIAVYTRNGGGNRQHWDWDKERGEAGEDCDCTGCIITYRLPKHPNYLSDQDDEFDCTYATVYFSFPEEYAEQLKLLDKGEKFDPDERWLAAIKAMEEQR